MKVLIVGDVHAVPEELEDCRKLFGLVNQVAKDEEVDEILLTGDLYHTMAVMRVEVLAFWRKTFKGLSNVGKTLVGNHDFGGSGTTIHSLMAHEDQIQVIDEPHLERGVLYMPYYDDREKFVADANRLGGKTLICHQTFYGSKYEGGFYAPENDSVNPDLLPQEQIVSGHIHSPQAFGKVWYVGAPRWRTLSDANTERAIWVVTFDDEGRLVDRKAFDTGTTCRQIRYVIDSPETPFEDELTADCDWRIDIRGPEAFVEARRPKFARPGIKVRSFPDAKRPISVKESEGVDKAFVKYIEGYVPKWGTSAEILASMARERLGL